MDAATRRALFGTDEQEPPALALRAGPLSLRLRGTRLLAVHAGAYEVWHGVAFLYRDTAWGTPEPVVTKVEHTIGRDAFSVRLQAFVPVQPRIDLCIAIDGESSGRVRYEAAATAQGDIATHRTGLCLMHPMSAMGHAIEIEHADSRVSRSTFPRLVAPWPPFMQVRAIRHEFAGGEWAECRFEGDVFEFEDQRNNADASFKTYSRSNLMPRPYRLRAGVPIRQAVTLRLHSPPPADWNQPTPAALVTGNAPRRAAARGEAATSAACSPPCERRPLRVGIGLVPRDLRQAERLLPCLRELAPAQLHLVLDSANAPIDAHGLSRLLEGCNASLRLDIAAVAPHGTGLAALAAALREARVEPESVGVFPSDGPAVDAARRAFPGAAIGGGTPHFFAQINRIEDLGAVDFLSFTTSSVVHGADDESVMAGLQSLPWLVQTLHAAQPGRPVRVGPSGIATCRSPLGQQPESDGSRRLALARRDPRSSALYGAAWVLGHVAALAHAGVSAVSVLGLGAGEGLLLAQGERLRLSPAARVLCELGAATHVRPGWSGMAHIAALAWDHNAGSTLLVANLSGDPSELEPGGWPVSSASIMDVASWISHATDDGPSPWRPVHPLPGARLQLPAYAIARLRA